MKVKHLHDVITGIKVVGKMIKEIKCGWCGELTLPNEKKFNNEYGNIIERRCSKCDKVLAAYLVEEGNFLPKIRTFSNP